MAIAATRTARRRSTMPMRPSPPAASVSTAASCRPDGLVSSAASRAAPKRAPPLPMRQDLPRRDHRERAQGVVHGIGVGRRRDEREHRRQQRQGHQQAGDIGGNRRPATGDPDERPAERDERAGDQPVDEGGVPRRQAGAADDRLGEGVDGPVVDLRIGGHGALIGGQRRPFAGQPGRGPQHVHFARGQGVQRLEEQLVQGGRRLPGERIDVAPIRHDVIGHGVQPRLQPHRIGLQQVLRLVRALQRRTDQRPAGEVDEHGEPHQPGGQGRAGLQRRHPPSL